jgi:hypothetical protein
VPFFTALGVVGAVCGLLLALLGALLGPRTGEPREAPTREDAA